MAALARWCVRHRLVVVLLWLAAFGGVTAAAAVTGSAYSNDYEVPGTESGRATQLLEDGFPGLGGDTRHRRLAHRRRHASAPPDVEQTMTRDPGPRSPTCPAWPPSTARTSAAGPARISADGADRVRHRHLRRVRPRTSTRARPRPSSTTAKAAEADGLQVELGGSAIALTESPGGHVAEIIGVVVAAVVLFLAFGSLAASAAAHRHRPGRASARRTPGSCCSATR